MTFRIKKSWTAVDEIMSTVDRLKRLSSLENYLSEIDKDKKRLELKQQLV